MQRDVMTLGDFDEAEVVGPGHEDHRSWVQGNLPQDSGDVDGKTLSNRR
jgi:hypothetical protein